MLQILQRQRMQPPQATCSEKMPEIDRWKKNKRRVWKETETFG
jgi:hypothetical protein